MAAAEVEGQDGFSVYFGELPGEVGARPPACPPARALKGPFIICKLI